MTQGAVQRTCVSADQLRVDRTPRTGSSAARVGQRSGMTASSGVRFRFRWLQARQAAIKFSQVSRPPRLLGKMWSIVVAGPPQYPHRFLSRCRIARRVARSTDSPPAPTYGTKTYACSWISSGNGIDRYAERTCRSSSATMISAWSHTTADTARCHGTHRRGVVHAFLTRTDSVIPLRYTNFPVRSTDLVESRLYSPTSV